MRLAALLALLLSIGPPAALSATDTWATAPVGGLVLDAGGAPIAGALVSLRRDGVGYARSTRTEGAGRFRLEAPPGDYEISASADGFSVARQAVHLPLESPEISFTLRPGVFTEEINVVGTRVAGG